MSDTQKIATDQFVSDTGRSSLADGLYHSWRATQGVECNFRPRADIYERDDAYVIEIELPGVSLERTSVVVHNNVLTVSGERPAPNHGHCMCRIERFHGTFCRSFTFSKIIDEMNIEAELSNGLLLITLPKHADAKSRTVSVIGE